MSGDAASLQCPVCFHSGSFDCADSIRNRLISIRLKAICPICQEVFPGIEKLIEHLLCHIKLIPQNKIEVHKKTTQNHNDNNELQQKRSRSAVSKNKTVASSSVTTANEPIKYVKIYPKLPTLSSNSVPVVENSSNQTGQSIKQESILKSENDTTCGLCGLQFIDTKILKMHLCLIHNIEDNSNITFTRYQCHICPKNFKMRGSLMVHLRVAHYGFSTDSINIDSVINKTSEGSESEKLLNTKQINSLKGDNKQWQCDVCKKFFTTKYFLKKHKRLHTGETPYACTQCNKTFTFQQSYHKHLLYHNDEKPHCCTFCGRAFKELSTLHNHQRIHTGEKPFSCETCGKSFRQRVSYLVHRRIHTGAMPYKCTACNKSFRYKVSQRTHKCQAQPPGTVIRQNVNLVEKLKRKHVSSDEMASFSQPNNYLDISDANAELALCGAKLSLEDTESENFNLLAEAYSNQESNLNKSESGSLSFDPNLEDLIDSIPIEETNVPSPSEILKNLCLSQDSYDDLTNIIDES